MAVLWDLPNEVLMIIIAYLTADDFESFAFCGSRRILALCEERLPEHFELREEYKDLIIDTIRNPRAICFDLHEWLEFTERKSETAHYVRKAKLEFLPQPDHWDGDFRHTSTEDMLRRAAHNDGYRKLIMTLPCFRADRDLAEAYCEYVRRGGQLALLSLIQFFVPNVRELDLEVNIFYEPLNRRVIRACHALGSGGNLFTKLKTVVCRFYGPVDSENVLEKAAWDTVYPWLRFPTVETIKCRGWEVSRDNVDLYRMEDYPRQNGLRSLYLAECRLTFNALWNLLRGARLEIFMASQKEHDQEPFDANSIVRVLIATQSDSLVSLSLIVQATNLERPTTTFDTLKPLVNLQSFTCHTNMLPGWSMTRLDPGPTTLDLSGILPSSLQILSLIHARKYIPPETTVETDQIHDQIHEDTVETDDNIDVLGDDTDMIGFDMTEALTAIRDAQFTTFDDFDEEVETYEMTVHGLDQLPNLEYLTTFGMHVSGETVAELEIRGVEVEELGSMWSLRQDLWF